MKTYNLRFMSQAEAQKNRTKIVSTFRKGENCSQLFD